MYTVFCLSIYISHYERISLVCTYPGEKLDTCVKFMFYFDAIYCCSAIFYHPGFWDLISYMLHSYWECFYIHVCETAGVASLCLIVFKCSDGCFTSDLFMGLCESVLISKLSLLEIFQNITKYPASEKGCDVQV